MSETKAKRDSGVKQSNAWVESSFTTDSPSNSKKRRVDTLAQDQTVARTKPRPPAWVASEFTSQPSPSKPVARLPPPRPRDTIKVPTKPASDFFDPNAALDPKPKKPFPSKRFAVQPVPEFFPKTPKDESAHRSHDPTLFRIQAPVFQTNNPSSAISEGPTTLRDVAPMPPAPRIEPKTTSIPPAVINVDDDRDYVPLTDLIMPRVTEISNATMGKGKTRVITSDEDLPISDNAAVGEATRAAEDVQNEIEAFGLNDLSLELDPDTSHVGYSDDTTRKAATKFLKGGLAARALMLITQREKDDALWHHYQTAKLIKNSNNREDLRARVVQVLEPVGDSVLVRCSIPSANSASITAERGTDDPLTGTNLVDVLLSRPGTRGFPAIGPEAVIRLWKPWVEINLDTVSRPLPEPLEGNRDDKHLRTSSADDGAEEMRDCPVDLPRREQCSRSYSEKLAHDRRLRRALLCSRFVVD